MIHQETSELIPEEFDNIRAIDIDVNRVKNLYKLSRRVKKTRTLIFKVEKRLNFHIHQIDNFANPFDNRYRAKLRSGDLVTA